MEGMIMPPPQTDIDSPVPPMAALTVRAEQALLGEILHLAAAGQDPMEQLTWGVAADDFYRPYHQQVFAAAVRLSERGQTALPQAVSAELADDPDLPAHMTTDSVRLIDLMGHAPGSGSLPTVVLMVMEAALRRKVSQWGIRMAQAVAENLDFRTLHTYVDTVVAEAIGWRRRIRRLPEPKMTRRRDQNDDPRPYLRLSAGADPSVTQLETDLLASLTGYPEQIPDITAWLREEYLTPGWTQSMYRLMTDRHRRGGRIDPLSLAWLAQRHGLPDPEQILTLLAGGRPWGEHLARQVHTGAVRALTQTTANRLDVISDNLQMPPHSVLDEITTTLTELQRHIGHYLAVHAPLPGTAAPSSARPKTTQGAEPRQRPVTAHAAA
jgi:DnaB-like helicase N terminal domain